MKHALILVALTALALPASSSAKREKLSDEAKLARELGGLTPGKAVSCIDLRDSQGTEAYGNALIFRVGRKFVYRNDTSGGCGRRSDDIFVTETFGSRLCRGDVIRMADRMTGMHSGFCIAGDFTPYRMPKS